MNSEHGITAVKLARCIVTQETTKKKLAYMMHLPYNEPSGVFVTINNYSDNSLRGCIGFIEPVYPFLEALEHAARSACHDPRFPSLKEKELDHVVIDVTVLTSPQPIEVKEKADLLNAIRIGRDGLVLDYRGRRSVFLPQVPVEWNWNVTEYLENLCMKAGVRKDAWKEKDCHIFAFQGRLFRETSPNGDVEEVIEC
jgi:uncharacterized protein (TIGR00296 family)